MELSRQEVLIRLRRMAKDDASIVFDSDMSTAELRSIYAAHKEAEKTGKVDNITVLAETLLHGIGNKDQQKYQPDTLNRLLAEVTSSEIVSNITEALKNAKPEVTITSDIPGVAEALKKVSTSCEGRIGELLNSLLSGASFKEIPTASSLANPSEEAPSSSATEEASPSVPTEEAPSADSTEEAPSSSPMTEAEILKTMEIAEADKLFQETLIKEVEKLPDSFRVALEEEIAKKGGVVNAFLHSVTQLLNSATSSSPSDPAPEAAPDASAPTQDQPVD